MKRFFLLSVFMLFYLPAIYPCSPVDINSCKFLVEPEAIKLLPGEWDRLSSTAEISVLLNDEIMLFNFQFLQNSTNNVIDLKHLVESSRDNVYLCSEPENIKFTSLKVPVVDKKFLKIDWKVWEFDSNPCAFRGAIADLVMEKQELIQKDKISFTHINGAYIKRNANIIGRSDQFCSFNSNFEICYRIYISK